jgi:hypothetical protein
LHFHDPDFVVLNLARWQYPPGHPDTWPPGSFSDTIHRCRQQRGGGLQYNNISGYVGVSWHIVHKTWAANIRKDGRKIFLTGRADLLYVVKVADIAAIHLGRDKINLGRDHYPPGPPRDWPEESIPDCPALRRLIGE